MGESEKRKLVPLEVDYYCMLASVARAEVSEGWIDTQTNTVELVKVNHIDRITVTAQMTGAPKP